MMEDNLWWKTTYDGRRLMMEDDLWWKTTYHGRWLKMEDDLWWKTTYDGRWLMMEDDLWLNTTYDGTQLMMEDNLWWKTTYDGRRLMMEDDWRRLMMEDDLWWKTSYHEKWQWGRPQKQRGLAHWWKVHGAGHIPLYGIFFLRTHWRLLWAYLKTNSRHFKNSSRLSKNYFHKDNLNATYLYSAWHNST